MGRQPGQHTGPPDDAEEVQLRLGEVRLLRVVAAAEPRPGDLVPQNAAGCRERLLHIQVGDG